MTSDWGPDRALYAISVAAELTGVKPQVLRVYENRGLLEPQRTPGGTRRYSRRDIERINKITTLLASGLNLAGVEQVLALQAETQRLRDQVQTLRRQTRDWLDSVPRDGTS
jgi:MerR family transcriptional regulator, heat shock protein HspR